MASPLSERARLLLPFRTDFDYYAQRCLTIRTKGGDLARMHMNRAQRYAHQCLEAQLAKTGKVRALFLKGRQQGLSTYTEARYFHRTTMHFGRKAVVMAHMKDSANQLFGMVRRFYDNCPDVLRPSASAASAKELHFDQLDSGYLVGTAGSREMGRGWTAQYFHGSEFAFWDNADDHFAGVGQAVPNVPGSEVILESTANGVGNRFYRMCMDALAGRGEYVLVFIPWFWQEEYRAPLPEGFVMDPEEAAYAETYGLDAEQAMWRRLKIVDDFGGDTDLFDQEYPATPALAFRKTYGTPLIPLDLIERARKRSVEPSGAKIMGVDPAEYGDDDSAIAKRQGRRLFPLVRKHGLNQMQLAGLVAKEADAFGPDAICVDVTGGYGGGVAARLLELGYPVIRVNFGESAIEKEIYWRRRDEMWGEMKAWFESPEGVQIDDDDLLAEELSSPQYTYNSSRQLVLESKERMKERGIKSPDGGDASALTFAHRWGPTMEDGRSAQRRLTERMRSRRR